MKLNLKRGWVQIILLLCIVGLEFIGSFLINECIFSYELWLRILIYVLIGIFSSILLSAIIYGLCKGQFHLPSTNIIHAFINNSVVGRKIRLVYLILFMANLTWAINVALDFIVKWQFDTMPIFALILSAIACMFLIFPYSDEQPASDSSRNTIVTSLSCQDGKAILWRNLDLLLKPLLYGVYTNEEDKLHKLAAIKKIIIIPSNAIEKYPSVQSFYEEDQLHIQNNWTIQCNLSEQDKTAIGEKVAEFNKFVKEMNKEKNLREWKKKFENLLTDIVKLLLHGRTIKFKLTNPCSYEVFSEYTKALEKALRRTEAQNTFLYVSSGTSIASCGLAVYSVIGGRKILYTAQNQDNVVRSIYIDSKNVVGLYEDIHEREMNQ